MLELVVSIISEDVRHEMLTKVNPNKNFRSLVVRNITKQLSERFRVLFDVLSILLSFPKVIKCIHE
jgi:putative exporter of polyketide antibiotics